MSASGPASAPGPEHPRGPAPSSLRHITWIVVASGLVLVAFGAWWRGLDFAVAVLLGFGVVLMNFLWTKKAVGSVLLGGQGRAFVTLSFVAKFAVTGAVLYVAIIQLHLDVVGVLLGLSTLLVASLLLPLLARRTRRQA
jgi:ATP synthase I chain